jgi:large subunit ribosomal protein L1
MARHGKKYLEAKKQVDRDQLYDPAEALKLLKSVSYANFDETVEVHVRTGLDPRQADQQIRDVVVLPNGFGKQVVCAGICPGRRRRSCTRSRC